MNNNYQNLNHYIIPSNLLIKLTDLYKEIGKIDDYLDSLKDYKKILEEKCLILDTMSFSKLMNINITDSRMQSLLEKNYQPKNQQEEKVLEIKKLLELIKQDVISFNLNASELIGYLNKIEGKNKIKYSDTLITAFENKNKVNYSVRFLINASFDNYDEYINLKKYEKIITTSILYLDCCNLKPFSDLNEIASFILLYYSLLRIELPVFKYFSLFQYLLNHYDELNQLLKQTNINYFNGYMDHTLITNFIIDLCIASFNMIKEEVHLYQYKTKGLKSDNIELSILKLPSFFTKADVMKLHPEASMATINRVLNKLKEQGLIMPLGTGRSALWRKNVENIHDLDLSKLLG